MKSGTAALLALALIAVHPAPAVPPGTGAASHVSGGVGADEVQRLTARENEYALKLVFTLVEGSYVSDVRVVVKKAPGDVLLAFDAQGPIALVSAPLGAYVVEATYEGRTQARSVKLGPRLRTEYFRWPANPETDFTVRD